VTARLLSQLLVAGVPPLLSHLPVSVERLLGDRLAAVVRQLDRRVLSSPTARTAWSVRARREALRRFTVAGGRVLVGLLVDWTDETEGARLLEAARRQDWPDLVLVLLSSPAGALAAARAAARAPGRRRWSWRRTARPLWRRRWTGSSPSRQPGSRDPPRPGLAYGSHHVTDLVLARGYARSPLVGVDVRRSYLAPLDLGVEDASEEGNGSGGR
jgi:hypothetical protein